MIRQLTEQLHKLEPRQQEAGRIHRPKVGSRGEQEEEISTESAKHKLSSEKELVISPASSSRAQACGEWDHYKSALRLLTPGIAFLNIWCFHISKQSKDSHRALGR